MKQEIPNISVNGALQDEAKFWRVDQYDALECLRATFVRHQYPKHMHDTFAIGVIEQGVEKFFAGGESHIAPAGSIALFGPQELHDGRAASDGFSYRVTYPAIGLMESIVTDLRGKAAEVHFREYILDDPALAGSFLAFHDVLEHSHDRLEQDSAFTTIMSELIQRHGDLVFRPTKAGEEGQKIAMFRRYIDDLFAEDIPLADLGDLCQLNHYHLLRSFRRELGITPHAYQTMRRIEAAKQKLERGDAVTGVAVDCGFYDQSHLSRAFKKHVGLSPGQYRGLFKHSS